MELRFPIDMGILIITCPNCTSSFRMDPDDPRTYQSGSFDLTPPKKPLATSVPFLNQISNYLKSNKDIKFLIPIFLLLVLLLNIVKIYNSAEELENTEKEKKEFSPEPLPREERPDVQPRSDSPSVEI
jgi:hypothetical protein